MKKTILFAAFLALYLSFASLGAGDTWTQKADMPTRRGGHASSVVNGKIYVIGGRLEKSLLTTIEEYDPATDTRTTQSPMPTARSGHASSVVNGKIYAIRRGPMGGVAALSRVEAYDPATDTWTQKLARDRSGVGWIG